jgi:hypothetical protein
MGHAPETQTTHSASSLSSFKGKRPFERTTEFYVWRYLDGVTESKWRKIGHFTDYHRRYVTVALSGFGGIEDACWPLVPKFAGSNPAGFFRAKKFPARLPSEGK